MEIIKILINFGTLKIGGGQNVGLNFLSSLLKSKPSGAIYTFIAVKNSEIYNFLIVNKQKNIIICPRNPIKRIIFELFQFNQIIKKNNIDIVYTYFGFALFWSKVPQVIGSADSNLYFPEIDFWSGYKGFSLMKRKLVDKYRIWGLKRANGIIFENEILEKKYKEIFDFGNLTTFIKPSVLQNFDNKKFDLPKGLSIGVKRGLFLCGWHLNKNIMKIPKIASILKKRQIKFHFIFTAPADGSPLHNEFTRLLNFYGVKDMVSIVGPVGKEQLADLYTNIDYVFLLSKLESFSNNIIEAWIHRRVLIISDEEWAHAICKDSAIYVNRDCTEDIVEKLIKSIDNELLNEQLVNNGTDILKSYPTIEEKTKLEINFLHHVYENA